MYIICIETFILYIIHLLGIFNKVGIPHHAETPKTSVYIHVLVFDVFYLFCTDQYTYKIGFFFFILVMENCHLSAEKYTCKF